MTAGNSALVCSEEGEDEEGVKEQERSRSK